MDKATRNILRSAVTDMRRILETSVSRELEGQYGIYESGKIDDISLLRQLDEEGHDNRERLLVHLEHIQAAGLKPDDAVDQLQREIAFTHLNRLAAFKLMEARGLIREAVTRSTDSQGFQFYLADDEEAERLYDTGHQDIAYRRFLLWQASQFDDEISVLFSPLDSANFIFPPHRVLEQVLDLLNSEALADIWDADETIGWIYQYFTPKELRDKARKESQAPRNSYELAFRNQFYTPRYVVEFLTDNTLGRTWYEMRQSDTVLTDHCQYLVRRPNEIFMTEGEEAPELGETSHLSQEELLQQPVYIPYRAYKDPRRLKVLDPACGSAHFLLYCFDLLVLIYEEAWERELGDPIGDFNLSEDYETLDDLRRDIPRLILRHNLHGIDIDRRATQIAALALWLKAQRYYNDYDIKSNDRPKITQGNIVLAEPMPGDKTLLKEFTATLNPPILGQLVERVFDKMQLAGEAGSLLKIEEAIQEDIQQAKSLWETGPTPQQMALFPDLATKEEYKQRSLFDVSAIDDTKFWTQTEKLVLEALEAYAQHATDGKGLQRRLFAQDAATGFAFIEVLRKRYDIVLMNPPFGSSTDNTYHLFSKNAAYNLYSAFVVRGTELATGFVGAITDRTFIVQKTFQKFRQYLLKAPTALACLIDLGWGILDTADVQVAAYTVRCESSMNHQDIIFYDLVEEDDKATIRIIQQELLKSSNVHILNSEQIASIPNEIFAYSLPNDLIKLLRERKLKDIATLPRGLGSNKAARTYKAWYEIPENSVGNAKRYQSLANGGDFSPFYREDGGVADWQREDGELLVNEGYHDGFSAYDQRNTQHYFSVGLSFPKQSTLFNVAVLTPDAIPTREGKSIIFDQHVNTWGMLGYLNSGLVRYFVDVTTGLHKQSGAIGFVPIPELSKEVWDELGKVAYQLTIAQQSALAFDESSRLFITFCKNEKITGKLTAANTHLEIENILAKNLNIAGSTQTAFLEKAQETIEPIYIPAKTDILSYTIGTIFGRWDIRYATGEKIIPVLPNPFEPLPLCPPGMLQNEDGLPATETPAGYPLEIDWDGIMVDDESHPDDIVLRVRDVLHLLWGDNASNIEDEMLDILGEKSLRSYFQKSGNNGFFMNHVKRYSKSRRKAPIYWYLRSSNGNYGLWFYYHRMDSDFYYKALINYVEPRVQRAENHLNDLKTQQLAAGSAGSEAKRLADEIEKQEDLVAELRDFHDKLKAAADLRLNPDLNDGVVLNIAPLHELVPWKEASKYWKELLDGKYEWSSIGRQLREKGMVK